MKRLWIGLVLVAAAGGAARADDRCDHGHELATKAKLAKLERARALLYLAACPDGDAARSKLERAADKAGDTEVRILAGGTVELPVEIDKLTGETVTAPTTVWLPAGDYKFTAHLPDGAVLIQEQSLVARTTATVLFEPGPISAPPPPRNGTADFTDGEPDAGGTYLAPPPKEKHKSLISDHYKIKENLDENPEVIHERSPFAVRGTIGVRAGGGVADSEAGAATGAVSFAALARTVIAGDWLAGELRVDLGPRGSDAAHVWTVGATAQARWYPAEATGVRGLSLAAGGRVEIRTRDSIDAMSVERFGAGATAAIGFEPGRKRFAVELRGEQALSSLAGGHPRVILLEVGFNL